MSNFNNISRRKRDGTRSKWKALGDHREFLRRVTKSLYYGELPKLPCLSLPVTELSADLFSAAQRGRSLKRLHMVDAAEISRNACVSPCSLVLAILYLERLKACNTEYLAKIAPSELFLVSLMISNKFLQDDGEEDEVFCDEWAASGGIDVKTLQQLERAFLQAIDWRVYISEQSFAAGLSWLEKTIALKQANARGWFTYADLFSTSDNLSITELVKSLATVCVTLSISYAASLAAMVTSTLMITQMLLPILSQKPVLPSNVDTQIADVNIPIRNATVMQADSFNNPCNYLNLSNYSKMLESDLQNSDLPSCCAKYNKYCNRLNTPRHSSEYNSNELNLCYFTMSNAWSLNWLYRTPLFTPLQKWLDNLEDVITMYKMNTANFLFNESKQMNHRDFSDNNNVLCTNRWSYCSKPSSFIFTMTDR